MTEINVINPLSLVTENNRVNLDNGTEATEAAEAAAAAKAEAEAAEAEAEAEIWSDKYTNEALVKLRTEAEAAAAKGQTFKFGTKGYMQSFEAVQAITAKIKAEIAGIKKQEIEAAKAAKVQAINDQFEAVAEAFEALGVSKANGVPAEVYDAEKAAATALLDGCKNLVLGAPKQPTATAANSDQSSQSSSNGASHGNVNSAIISEYVELRKGMNHTEAVKALQSAPYNNGEGFKRGSVNTYTRNYRLSIGEITE